MKAILSLLILMTTLKAHGFIPTEAYTFDFNITTVRMTKPKERKLHQAVELLRLVFASSEFRKQILLHRYRGRYGFYMNDGESNRVLYAKILDGVEKLYPYQNNAMDVEVELYADFESKVMGYTYPRTRRIWMNTKYFNRHTTPEIAGHLVHEWLHKLGYDHERQLSPRRRYSVPYAVGTIVKKIGRQIEWKCL